VPSKQSIETVDADFRAFTIGEKRVDTGNHIGVKLSITALKPCSNEKNEVHNVSSTFEKVADIIADTSEIDRETITPESHTIDDLGIDSLDFLDIVFAIDKAFGIKIPLEQWTQDVNEGRAPTEEYFVLKNLCGKIDELVAKKA
jgi:acyl carrier protein